MKPVPEQYRLILEPTRGDARPGDVRLRSCLKRMLRELGLRCVAAERVDLSPTTAQPQPCLATVISASIVDDLLPGGQ